MYSRVHPYIPGVVIADQNTATIGAYHTSDVPYWFGSQDALNIIRPTRNWTPLDRDLSNKMTDTLIAFAKTGDPKTPAVQWPQWSPQNEQLVEFGDKISAQAMNTARLDFMASRSGGGRGAPGGRSGRGASADPATPRARD
jgi:para-nitrobenzyl esterase